jgi:hypothetical protein
MICGRVAYRGTGHSERHLLLAGSGMPKASGQHGEPLSSDSGDFVVVGAGVLEQVKAERLDFSQHAVPRRLIQQPGEHGDRWAQAWRITRIR